SEGMAVSPPFRSSRGGSFRGRSRLAGCFFAANNSENSGGSARWFGLGRSGARLLRAIGTRQGAAALGRHVAIVDTLGVGGLVGEALFEGLGLLRNRRGTDTMSAQLRTNTLSIDYSAFRKVRLMRRLPVSGSS